jgi:NAD(P)-dependent dehydrogenase (short-subunit alcohol dehydrogenase family)
MTFEGRVAIITGGASGIGRAVARRLSAEGAAVAVADASRSGAETLAKELTEAGARAIALQVDVSNSDEAARMVEGTLATFDGLDILIHSAGIGVERAFLETSPEEWRRIIDVDLSGTFYCCQAAAREMVKRGYGRIVTLASVAGLHGGMDRAAYGAAKGGVITLTKVMAVELAAHGITVNALAPGPIETEMVKKMHSPGTRRAYRAAVPLDRYGTPEEVADSALFLAGEAAGYVTGHVLTVDGGFMAAGIRRAPPEP